MHADSTVLAYLEASANRTPSAIAVVDAQSSLTYEDLMMRCMRIGTALARMGATDRSVVIAMEKIRRLNESLSLRNRVLQETFGRYLSDDIVREILESPDGWKLGGQKRTLTIMMSDIRGFTMLCERMEPQDLVTMVNHYFSEMYEEISRYNGTLIEFLGDGMFVIFGAPVTTQAHASDAVAAAIGMQKRMKAVNEWNAERGFEPLSMGIAINSDEVILGNIGSERRTKYGVLGAPVNLTGRLESYAAGGQILISSSTRDLIREEVTVDFTRNVSPKGVHGDITICGVSGIGAPYNRYLDEKTDRPVLLPAPAEVKYYLLDGKHVIGRSRKAAILSVSEGQAVMETEEEIFTCDNLKLDVGDGLYALVTHTENDLTTIRFTARPAGFGQWLEQIGFAIIQSISTPAFSGIIYPACRNMRRLMAAGSDLRSLPCLTCRILSSRSGRILPFCRSIRSPFMDLYSA